MTHADNAAGGDASQIDQLIYYSSARGVLQSSDLRDILEASIRHNAEDGITGMLLHHDGNFVQVLEGSAQALDKTIKRIVSDSRHHGVNVIMRTQVPRRSFPGWQMGFYDATLDELREHPGVLPMRNGKPDFSTMDYEPSRALSLLRLFGDLAG